MDLIQSVLEFFEVFDIRRNKLKRFSVSGFVKTASNRARNWQERGKKTYIIVRDRTRIEIEKSPEIGAFLAKNANFDRNAPPWG